MAGEGAPTWEEVARSHGRFLYTVAYRLTGNREDAQDLVQEVLLRVRRGLQTYEPGSMEGWLSRIATNAFLDDVRRRKRRPEDLLPDDPDWVLPPTGAADEALAAEVLPDDIQAALRRLPEDFRAAVVLCDVVGLSYQEIGDSLGIPVGTVRSRIHRGRALLRQVLTLT
ncbi:MAG TPA: sigma-70 family RNA polymerase sigma factor [Acidimicrobiales bacterium]|jgi:RNA polymerase sigma-70 factor (ECF subfamily)|nr:sigma-70 family RNA polymerase sigma factor [Acidimicrobiales bacterium]